MTYCYDDGLPHDHECWDYAVEVRGTVSRAGGFVWWTECERCAQVLTKPQHDSVI